MPFWICNSIRNLFKNLVNTHAILYYRLPGCVGMLEGTGKKFSGPQEEFNGFIILVFISQDFVL